MKKFLTLLGSARKKGNTATVLSWVEDELRSLGETVERIDLTRRNIHGCLGCKHCRESAEPLDCAQKNDDAIPIYRELIQAKAVIYASPLYYWGFSAQMKALVDRGYMLVKDYGRPTYSSLVEGQPQALLVTCAGPRENNADSLVTAFARMVGYHKARVAGTLVVPGCTEQENLPSEIRELARELAWKVSGRPA